MNPMLRVAGVQMDIQLGEPTRNLARISQEIEAAARQGAQLVVFPECAVTGYCFDSLEEARPFGESIPGPATEQVHAVCREHGVSAAFGMLEAAADGFFNACVLVGPEGLLGSYRKIHLPYLGIDRFTTPGNRPFAVHAAGEARIGMNICYDSAFPESARVMALDGADVIVLPTNFPPGAECMTGHVIHARAMENKVFYVCVNRVGTERGFSFIGHSKICDPAGGLMAGALHEREEVLFADLDLIQARTKRVVRVPDKHIIDRFADRRPKWYGRIVGE